MNSTSNSNAVDDVTISALQPATLQEGLSVDSNSEGSTAIVREPTGGDVGSSSKLAASACWTLASCRGVGTSSVRSLLASPVKAGAACKLNDVCDAAAQYAKGNSVGDLCPVNTTTNVGVCPDVYAGGVASTPLCSPGDMCASSATTSAPCAIIQSTDESGTLSNYGCPYFPAGATCSQFTGECAEAYECNARMSENEADFGISTTVGVCVTPIAAGSACTAGYDLCSGSSSFEGSYCASGTCPVARPGSSCSAPDVCSAGLPSAGTTTCGASDPSNFCPRVVTNGGCFAGDFCTGQQVCNAVGTAAGTCITPASAGTACTQGVAMCITGAESIGGLELPISEVCSSNKCPFATAEGECFYGDYCSDGSSAGSACSGAAATGALGSCAVLATGSTCYAGDECQNQQCNAVGTAAGTCVDLTAAGAACTASDLCLPFGGACPSTMKCPYVDAGRLCNGSDLCSSGLATATTCPADNGMCPKLISGAACTATDYCVYGAFCIGALADGSASGICTPFVKASAARYSTSAVVPAVTSVAKLSMYSNADAFNTTEKTRFINVLESNIYTKIHALVNVTITKVTSGSAVVDNTVAFTSSDSSAAAAGRSALFQILSAGDTSIFGSSFALASGASAVTPGIWTLVMALVVSVVSLSM
ncbi:hypothetical protein WJX77_012565 [Trebouxia sp. C0004]